MKPAFVLVALLVLAPLAQGQPEGGGPGGGGEPVPISGIEWLMVIGGLFGARKFYQRIKGKK